MRAGIAWWIVHIVIMGCGRTGAVLATEFEGRGHSVAIIDQTADAFRRLPADFQGQKITGVGFDRDTLVAAGVEDAYGFAAVSDGDNSNILAARVVRETYGVENVVARISDQDRAEVYQRLGITTVAPVPWTSAQILTRILPVSDTNVYTDPSAGVTMRRVSPHEGWVGKTYADVEAATSSRVSYVVRFKEGIIPDATTLVQDGDEAHVVALTGDEATVDKVLSKPPASAGSGKAKSVRKKQAVKK